MCQFVSSNLNKNPTNKTMCPYQLSRARQTGTRRILSTRRKRNLLREFH
uniref:Uncharacterized protein n=1 Tax=Arundo donax TaxID=35708 RepID=A0A0A9GPS5_ARUDO